MTKAEWYEKIKGLVQTWVVQDQNAKAIFKGIAAVTQQVESDYLNHVDQTFIDKAELEYDLLHGEERSIVKIPEETHESYRVRLKRITNQSNFVELKYVVDGFLNNGESKFIEHSKDSGSFCDNGHCLDRDILDFDVLFNAFTIIVEHQTGEDSDQIFENIVKAVNTNKAGGIVYRLIERVG